MPPLKWRSKKALEEAIEGYFEDCRGKPYIMDDGTALMDKSGEVVLLDARPPTITGLALWLGFTGRQALVEYQAREDYGDTITRAKARCEEYAERRLYDRDGTRGAQFSLSCNFGWKQTQTGEMNSGGVVMIPEVKSDG